MLEERWSRRNFLRLGLGVVASLAISTHSPNLVNVRHQTNDGKTEHIDTIIPIIYAKDMLSEKIEIPPALVIPDCSQAKYVPIDELELTRLGKQKIYCESWKVENEWSDATEIKLLDNVYNRIPNTGEAYLRLKYDIENLYGVVVWSSENEKRRGNRMFFMVDTEYKSNYDVLPNDIGLIMEYDRSSGKKRTYYMRGRSYGGWPSTLEEAPPDIISSSGLAVTDYSKDDQDKCLIFKFRIPMIKVNPNNLLRERISVSVGRIDSGSFLAYPENSDYKIPYTWADAFYMPETQAIPTIPKLGLPLIEAAGVCFAIITAKVLNRFYQKNPKSPT